MRIENKHTPLLEVLFKEKYEKISAYEITKRMFKKLNVAGVRAKTSTILDWLKVLVESDLVEEKKENGKTSYSIIRENIKFDDKNPRTIVAGMVIDYEKAFAIRVNDGWQVITFED